MNKSYKFFLFVAICCSHLAFGQRTQDTARDSLSQKSDTTKIDTIVIRWKKTKLKINAIGVRRIAPKTGLNKTKAFTEKPKKFVPPTFWLKQNNLGLNINEVAFVNWNAGGDNSISALANLAFVRNYKFRYLTWENELRFRYGINAQEGRSLRKTEDLIRFTSTFGFRKDTLSNWFYSAKAKFNTQFSNGFNYPDRETPISRFMAPGYLFFGAGTSYIKPDNSLNIYISPTTLKATFVSDQALADNGAFGVTPGNNSFIEFGFLLTQTWQTEVFKNVQMNHRINLYTDYLRSFGNVDMDWELNFQFKVNEYISANIGTHVIYDDDIKFDQVVNDAGDVIDPGIPRIQFKQALGLGLGYSF
ncbi:DUF3078 domain-containing protein [Muricauda sp. SCSIO 64092]|uniref:DUF3078 domain-containing protein n=1 Tax=Allomuricauda sp. SCSIO 64092 TaxID=2908842 RepID=UPI001FF3A938|nr:DUF3078 domain-containing protein [Muricauda sp. SCSIO 64092]UOY08593.1 DUF3078 domain-containing protein [Muricauda sp. SCSIO 64092]